MPRIQKIIVFLLLLCSFNCLSVAELQVTIVNHTARDLVVQSLNGGSVEIQPKNRAEVFLAPSQWIDFGMESFKFDTSALRAWILKSKSRTKITLLAKEDGRLWLATTKQDSTTTATKQPKGFPLKPKRKIDLT